MLQLPHLKSKSRF